MVSAIVRQSGAGQRWRAMEGDGDRGPSKGRRGCRRSASRVAEDRRRCGRARGRSPSTVIDRTSIERRWGIDIALAKGKALRRRITRSTCVHAARRRARRCRCAMRATMSRRLSSPSMRSSLGSPRRCRAVPRCAAMTPRRTPSNAPAPRANDLQCMPQSLVTCGFPASMRVLPRVVVAPVRGLAKGRRERRREVRAQRSRTASSAYR